MGRQSLGATDIQLIDGVRHLLFPGPELHTASSKECPQMMVVTTIDKDSCEHVARTIGLNNFWRPSWLLQDA
jgi:hypothetical protein